MPRAGIIPKPKINKGSSTILATRPIAFILKGVSESPRAVNDWENIGFIKKKIIPHPTINKYSLAKTSAASPSL